MRKESRVQSLILKDLRSFKRYCVCTKIQETSDDGFPDVFFTTSITGPILVEVKKEDGVTDPLQDVFIENLNSCGCKTFVCHSWEEWVKIKKQLGIHNREDVIKHHNNNVII